MRWPVVFKRGMGDGAIVVASVLAVYVTAERILHHVGGIPWGFDFRGGIWPAAHALLRGTSPYPAALPALLFHQKNLFVTPPLIGTWAIPVAHLPLHAAIAVWDILSLIAFAAGLRLAGLRDRRMMLLALASYPLIDTMLFGQSDGFLALLLAAGWRWRDGTAGPIAIGALVVAKLFAWPLLLWLLVTRPLRSLAVSLVSAIILWFTSWALLDFKGMLAYPRLLAADARAFDTWGGSLSLVAIGHHLGLSSGLAVIVELVVAIGVAGLIVAAGKRSDESVYTAAVAASLLASPLLWAHYLTILFIPLAACRGRRLSPWLLSIVLWVPLFSQALLVRAIGTVVCASAMAVWAASRHQRTPNCEVVASSGTGERAPPGLTPGAVNASA